MKRKTRIRRWQVDKFNRGRLAWALVVGLAAFLMPLAALGQAPTLELWLDGSDPSGDGSVHSGPVTTWIAKSGNNLNAAGGTGAGFNPSGLNGRGTVTFNGSQYLEAPLNWSSFGIGDDYTTFTVFETSAPVSSWSMVWANRPGNGPDHMVALGSSGLVRTRIFGGAHSDSPSSVLDGAGHVVAFGVSSGATFYSLDCAEVTPPMVGADSRGTTTTIGNRIKNDNLAYNHFNGSVAEIIVLRGTVSAVERNNVIAYLGEKWGVSVGSCGDPAGATDFLVEQPPFGAVITQAGSDLQTNDAWRTTDVAKPLDVDGDNIYGTDGWVLYNSASASAEVRPHYAGVVRSPGVYLYGPAGAYVALDDPDATGPGSVNNVNTGTVYRRGHSQEHDLVVITVKKPASFRLGVIQDNHDYAEISPISLRLRHTTGGNRNSGYLDTSQDRDRDGDYYFFDINDAQPGEVFVLSGVSSAGGHSSNGVYGVFFDGGPHDAETHDAERSYRIVDTADCRNYWNRTKEDGSPLPIIDPNPFREKCSDRGEMSVNFWSRACWQSSNDHEYSFGVMCGGYSFSDEQYWIAADSDDRIFPNTGGKERGYWTDNTHETIAQWADGYCRKVLDRSSAIACGYCYGHEYSIDTKCEGAVPRHMWWK